ncbi:MULTISPECIES: tRNA lysidine(34) synthetase TilS [unclassified Roseovarius]|uniref:tRNA lysidine(34) synthetase TilS n=1 Tax=unclassified Roseovarius TaxID=2614913 RepID=UPI00273EA5D6|nr:MULTISPECIES: tRNA lysidine(34) synthetase TilS [unclassified Roseovarius]
MNTDRIALLRDRIAGHFLPRAPTDLGIAVSGGSDSMGLMHVLHDWARDGGPRLHAVTVDHGLRPEAAEEARTVAAHAEKLGISHTCLKWEGWDGHGNLQDQARRARYRLMADWAQAQGITHVVLGHTADDQAETFLMRLSREAGVDGLSAMSSSRRHGRTIFCRPALRTTREELRNVLRERNVIWIDDPTNSDTAYARVRARKLLAEMAPMGITANTLTTVAHHMEEVRKTLYWYVFLAAREMVSFEAGDLLIARKEFRTLQNEVKRRLLQSIVMWIGSAEYAPRGRAIDLLMESIRGGTGMTLQGCRVMVEPHQLRVVREYSAVANMRAPVGEVWDNRWRLTGLVNGDALEIRALGPEGLRHCPEWRTSGLPEASQHSGPAVWQGDELIAAPLASFGAGWQIDLVRDEEDFFASLLSQ